MGTRTYVGRLGVRWLVPRWVETADSAREISTTFIFWLEVVWILRNSVVNCINCFDELLHASVNVVVGFIDEKEAKEPCTFSTRESQLSDL
jgi:hypothetical protein